MKKLLVLIAVAILALSVTGCATYSTLNAIDTGTAVSSANFHYVKSVQGQSTSTYIFCFAGGDDAGGAIQDAKHKAQLKDNQALTNVAVVNTQKFILGVVILVKTTVTADVIEFDK